VSWLKPVNYDYVEMPFASSLMFELHYNQTCLDQAAGASCFTVEIRNNGRDLQLDTCIQGNQARGSSSTVCQFEDFISHIDKCKLRGNLIDQCNQGYNPYP
jgi:hypothetical protein